MLLVLSSPRRFYDNDVGFVFRSIVGEEIEKDESEKMRKNDSCVFYFSKSPRGNESKAGSVWSRSFAKSREIRVRDSKVMTMTHYS